MKKINEIFTEIQTKKIAKKHWRTYGQEQYRENLHKRVREMRSYRDTWKELAESLLKKEKWNIQYVESLWKGRKAWKDVAEQLILS